MRGRPSADRCHVRLKGNRMGRGASGCAIGMVLAAARWSGAAVRKRLPRPLEPLPPPLGDPNGRRSRNRCVRRRSRPTCLAGFLLRYLSGGGSTVLFPIQRAVGYGTTVQGLWSTDKSQCHRVSRWIGPTAMARTRSIQRRRAWERLRSGWTKFTASFCTATGSEDTMWQGTSVIGLRSRQPHPAHQLPDHQPRVGFPRIRQEGNLDL